MQHAIDVYLPNNNREKKIKPTHKTFTKLEDVKYDRKTQTGL